MSVDRQGDAEAGTGPRFAGHLYVSAMLGNKTITNGESKPDTLYAAFGGKEGVEYIVDIFFFYTDTGVSYIYGDFVVTGMCIDGEGSTVRHGVSCIVKYI